VPPASTSRYFKLRHTGAGSRGGEVHRSAGGGGPAVEVADVDEVAPHVLEVLVVAGTGVLRIVDGVEAGA
jgi:hypothetical protein